MLISWCDTKFKFEISRDPEKYQSSQRSETLGVAFIRIETSFRQKTCLTRLDNHSPKQEWIRGLLIFRTINVFCFTAQTSL